MAIFFGTASYEDNVEMHEAFWASHINRAARSGILLGAREQQQGEEEEDARARDDEHDIDGDACCWRGFRCLFPPGKGWEPYSVNYVSRRRSLP